MNILFLTMSNMADFEQRGIYRDLLNCFAEKGHSIYVVSPAERKYNIPTTLSSKDNKHLLRVRIGNVQKCNIIEKGITTLTLGYAFKRAIKKHFSGVRFDLVLYSTPPITFAEVISFIKKRDNAATYLLLKDIFPQNAVDIGMMSKSGIKSVIYKIFRKKEKALYKTSDFIGCMSEANVEYLLSHNPFINPEIVHINPNSIAVEEYKPDMAKREEIREKYCIPQNARTFIYGGNLGKPQDIPFIIECLKENEDKADRFFVICGTGTEYPKLRAYVEKRKPKNVLLINGLPKEEYDELVKAFDVGLIFLDNRFTIPNFPSRILGYMQSKMPVLACTDSSTDIGKVITDGEFGWWCESSSPENFTKAADIALTADLKVLGENGFNYLNKNYTVERSYEIITERVKK